MSSTLTVMRPSDLILLLGATARMTRFLTTDTLGEWLIARPARAWANRAEKYAAHLGPVDPILLEEDVDTEAGPRSKAVSGLDCPYCCGAWVSFAALASYLLARRHRATLGLWRLAAGGLTLNYCTAHLSARID